MYRCVDTCGGGRYLYSCHCSKVCHRVRPLCCRLSCACFEDWETICNVIDGHATTYLGSKPGVTGVSVQKTSIEDPFYIEKAFRVFTIVLS